MRASVVALSLAASVAACGGGGGGGGDDDGSDGDPVDGGADDGDGGGGEADAGIELPDGPGLAGFLRLTDGTLLDDEQVLACMETTCYFGESDDDGFFFFGEVEVGDDVALKTAPKPNANPRRGAALCPVDIVDEDTVYAQTLYVPILPDDGQDFESADQDPQTMVMGDGLELTLNRGDLTPRVGDTLIDAAARAMAPEERCPQLVLPGEEIIAVYALHPFGATSSSPVAARAPSDLPADTEVFFRTIDEIEGNFSAPVPGTADGDFVETDPGEGIAELSWLVISY